MSSITLQQSIGQRLAQVDLQFLTAAEGDDLALQAFEKSFSALVADVHRAKELGQIDAETLSQAHAVTSRLSILCSRLHDMQTKYDALTVDLHNNLHDILDQATVAVSSPGLSPNDHSPASPISFEKSIPSPEGRHPCPPYIASAYKWLQNNLHKPYPTVEELRAICANSNTTEKRVKNWFTSARQRMGWTKIARDYFRRDREDTADAAYRALIEPDPKRPMDLKLMLKFVKMQVAAESMYSAAFKPTQFVGRLSTAVVGMSAEHKACIEHLRQQAIEEENMRKEAEYRMKQQRLAKRRSSQRRSVSLFPSPERSPSGSPQPTLVSSDTEDEIDTPPPNTATGRKRRRSSSSDKDTSIHKRPRNKSTPSASEPTSPPSSPVTVEENVAGVFDYWTSLDDITADPEPMISAPIGRKRRLSGADIQGPPKRPAGLAIGPRLRPVSDPIPRPRASVQSLYSMDWDVNDMALDFDIPDAVTSQPLDPSEPLHVEFFNWASDVSSGTSTPYSSPSPMASQEISLPTSDPPLPAAHEFDMSGSAGAEFNQFLRDFGMLPQCTQPQVADGTPIYQPDIPQALPIQSQTISAPICIVGDSWNPMPMYLESQRFDPSDLSSFDLPVLKSPSAPSPAEILAQSEVAARQAKLEQLHAHREAAKKLELELSSA